MAAIQIEVIPVLKLPNALPPSLWLAGWVVVPKYMTVSEEGEYQVLGCSLANIILGVTLSLS
jgi:hypothetical protein